VRLATALFSLGLVLWAFADDDLIGGGPGFGWSQGALLLAGLVLAAGCAASLEWNARVLAGVVSTALVLLAAELGLRLFLSPRYYPPFQPDARRLYKLVPGSSREYRRAAINGGGRILYRINSAGFRGEELEGKGDGLRIVVYGDSFIQAEYSIDSNTFAERLERHLSERLGRPVEVVNAGVAGYGPDQILRSMEDELAGLEPDLAIAALYAGNDFGDIVRNKLYRLDHEGRLQENEFTLSPGLGRKLEIARRESILKRIAREAMRAVGNSGGGAIAQGPLARRERLDSFLDQNLREYREYVVEGDNVVRELLSDPYNADVSLTPNSDSARYKIDLMDRLLARMKDTTDELGVPLVLVLIPNPIDVCDSHESGEVDAERYPEYERSALTGILQRIASRRRIPHVDLFGPFRERGAASLYFGGADDHWNDRGQDVGAELVARFLVSKRLLDGESAGSTLP
jgi:hypothetical protein